MALTQEQIDIIASIEARIAPTMPHDAAAHAIGDRLRAERSYVRIDHVRDPDESTGKNGYVDVIEVRAMPHQPGIEPTGRRGRIAITGNESARYRRWHDLCSAVIVETNRIEWA